jgi:hypothetical protein
MPAPNRGAAFISSTTRMWPPGVTSAISWRMELDPMSIAATRSVRPLGGRGATRRDRVRTLAGRLVGVLR